MGMNTAIITWENAPVPDGMEIRQVYGIIFTDDGRILLSTENKTDHIKYSLAGGHPEACDRDTSDTLRRELLEEINTTIHTPLYVEYQLVDEEDGTPLYAQVRMTAIIKSIGPAKADSDNGKTYGRLLTIPDKAALLLNWGEVGAKQIQCAAEILKNNCGVTLKNTQQEYV